MDETRAVTDDEKRDQVVTLSYVGAPHALPITANIGLLVRNHCGHAIIRVRLTRDAG